MLRRAFLNLVSSAGVAFVVGVHHFKPIPEHLVDIDVTKEEVTEQLSPVLMATRAWNEERWSKHGGVVWETEPVPLVKSRFSGGAVRRDRFTAFLDE